MRRRHPFHDRPPRTPGEIEEQLVYLHAEGEAFERETDVLRRLVLVAKVGMPVLACVAVAVAIWGQVDLASPAAAPLRWAGVGLAVALLAAWVAARLWARRASPSPAEVEAAARRLADLGTRLSDQPVTDPVTGHVLARVRPDDNRIFSFDPSAGTKVFMFKPTGSGAMFGIEALPADPDAELEALHEAIGAGSESAVQALFAAVAAGPVEATASMRTSEVNTLCDQIERALADTD